MLHTYRAGVSRQAVVLTAIVGLHFAVFVVVVNDLVERPAPAAPQKREIVYVPPPEPPDVVKPQPPDPGGFVVELKYEPDFLPPTVFDESAVVDESFVPQTGTGPVVSPPPDVVVAPTIAMRGSRLAALIDSCYPPSARRAGEEGRATVRLVIGADAKLVSWQVLQGTGFPRLDAAIRCVVEALVFTAGRRNGQAARSEAILPIVFRLH